MNAPSSSSLVSRLSPRKLRGVIVVGVIAIASTVALSAWARGGFGGGHGGFGMGGPMMGRMTDHMLDRVNATAEQRAQIKTITESAMNDLKGQRDAGAALRNEAMTLFAKPTVDASAVEALRQRMLAQVDQSSRRASQAMVDASRVLTPDQRKQLTDEFAKRSEMRKRHMDERRALDGQRN